MKRMWTEEEMQAMVELYADTKTDDICKMLNRSRSAVYGMAEKLNLKKSAQYPKDHVHVMGTEIGKETRFKKGQESWNKGRKMSSSVYEKAKGTMFKKGQLPHNTLQDGIIRTRTDKNGTKRPWIRVSLGKWVEMKNYVWQQQNGDIPKGYCIAVKDGNPFNYSIDNLECISKQENMQRNTIHNYPEEIKSTIRILTKLKKQTRDGEKQNE